MKNFIAVDVDGVCADFHGAVNQAARRRFKVVVEGTTTRWDWWTNWGDKGRHYWDSIWEKDLREGRLFERLEPVPGAQFYVPQLVTEGYRVEFVTQRPEDVADQTRTWIEATFPELENPVIHHVADKLDVGAGVMVDDKIENILAQTRAGRVGILFAQQWNEDAPSGMTRVYGWQGAYRRIHRETKAVRA